MFSVVAPNAQAKEPAVDDFARGWQLVTSR